MKPGVIAFLLALFATVMHAAEIDERKAIGAEFDAAFQREDFAAIEARYSRAVSSKERLASGVFVSSQMVYQMFTTLGSKPGAAKGNDARWKPIEEKAQRWAAQFPRSIIAAIALGKAYEQHGWEYRGGGYANSVSKEDWKVFHDYSARAFEVLSKRADAGKSDPAWWWRMLQLGRIQSWPAEQYSRFAREAVDAFPGYYDIHFEVAHGLTPQWGGSAEAVAAYADEAMKRTRSTDGAALYARIYWSVSGSILPQDWRGPPTDWRKIRTGFDDLIKRYPDPWNLNHYGLFACTVGDKPTAKRVLAIIGDNVDPSAWNDRGTWMRCKNWAAS